MACLGPGPQVLSLRCWLFPPASALHCFEDLSREDLANCSSITVSPQAAPSFVPGHSCRLSPLLDVVEPHATPRGSRSPASGLREPLPRSSGRGAAHSWSWAVLQPQLAPLCPVENEELRHLLWSSVVFYQTLRAGGDSLRCCLYQGRVLRAARRPPPPFSEPGGWALGLGDGRALLLDPV